MSEPDGWIYIGQCTPEDGDCRKIVTLEQGGMTWVGIRAYDRARRIWLNNGEPEAAQVIAWRDLPDPATKRWIRGQLL